MAVGLLQTFFLEFPLYTLYMYTVAAVSFSNVSLDLWFSARC